MTMTEKLNIDNGLQDWKTEHQLVTCGIFNCRDSGYFSVSAFNKLSCILTGQCFVIGNKNIPQPSICLKTPSLQLIKSGITIKNSIAISDLPEGIYNLSIEQSNTNLITKHPIGY